METEDDVTENLEIKISNLEAKLSKVETTFLNCKTQNKKLRDELRELEDKNKELQATVDLNVSYGLLKSLFNDHQIKQLSTKSKNIRWSLATYVKALKLKFSCSKNGYEDLLAEGFPLPSIRSLTRKLENLKLTSSICEEMFEFMKIKLESKDVNFDEDCTLILDEMNTTTASDLYDPSTCSFFGNVTLPGEDT